MINWKLIVSLGLSVLLLSGCGANNDTSADANANTAADTAQTVGDDSAASQSQTNPDWEDRSDTVEVNNISLYYEVKGSGKPIILVSANGGDHTNLYTERDQLVKAGYKVYSLDSRGQGNSTVLEEYHYEDMAEDIYQFIQALKLDKPAYYGWSDGGITGLLLSVRHPEALSIMAVSGANINPEGANPEDEVVKEVKAEYEETHDPLLRLMLDEPHIEPEELSAITFPVLVTAGETDLILPEHTKLIADSLPNGKMEIVTGHDHQTYIYQSEIMGDMLIDFLKENNY